MDGTLYLDDRLFDGVKEFLARIREKGGRYLFLTNNSSRGVESYMEKLGGMGIRTERRDYLTSVDAAIDCLRRRYPGKRCYVQGTRSFYGQLAAAGIPVTCDREDGVDILLSGFDRELTFQKLEDACILLERGAVWLATNPDWVCPTWYGSVPDCGSWRWRRRASRRSRRCSSATGCTPTSPARSMRASTAYSSCPVRESGRT